MSTISNFSYVIYEIFVIKDQEDQREKEIKRIFT